MIWNDMDILQYFHGGYFRYHSHQFSAAPKVVRLPERGVQSPSGEGGGAGLACADPRTFLPKCTRTVVMKPCC